MSDIEAAEAREKALREAAFSLVDAVWREVLEHGAPDSGTRLEQGMRRTQEALYYSELTDCATDQTESNGVYRFDQFEVECPHRGWIPAQWKSVQDVLTDIADNVPMRIAPDQPEKGEADDWRESKVRRPEGV